MGRRLCSDTAVRPLCAANQAGLGNRLKCLWSCRFRDSEAKIWWPTDVEDMAHYVHYYEFEPVLDIASYGELFHYDISVSKEELWESYEPVYDVWRIDATGLADGYVDYMFNWTPKAVVDAYLPIVERSIPSEPILGRCAGYDMAGLNGLHVRTLAGMKCGTDEHRTRLPLDRYIRGVELRRPCFLATDDQELRSYFAGDESVVMFPAGDGPLAYSQWDVALIEVLLLSRCDRLFVSPGSTFSEVAWWFGGCRQPVELFECQ